MLDSAMLDSQTALHSSGVRSVVAITHIPSPYQVEFFDQISASASFSLTAAYIRSSSPQRAWKMPSMRHAHLMLDDHPASYAELEKRCEKCDLVIFNFYQHPRIVKLINDCQVRRRSWCFWGERPGYSGYGALGVLYRKWKLAAVHRSRVPIWGMGSWAVERYRKEFGTTRSYFNIPYFSDLTRFKPESGEQNGASDSTLIGDNRREQYKDPQQRVFLYTGSLIPRKGVDLLAHAFSRLADEFPDMKLKIVGDGELRREMEERLTDFRRQVEFVGFVDWEGLPAQYKTADILCAPSRYDGWNLVVPEGLAAGLPVITTDRTGAGYDLIRAGENGWIAKAGCAESLYKAMREAAALSAGELKSMAQRAEASVAAHNVSDGAKRFQEAVFATAEINEQNGYSVAPLNSVA